MSASIGAIAVDSGVLPALTRCSLAPHVTNRFQVVVLWRRDTRTLNDYREHTTILCHSQLYFGTGRGLIPTILMQHYWRPAFRPTGVYDLGLLTIQGSIYRMGRGCTQDVFVTSAIVHNGKQAYVAG